MFMMFRRSLIGIEFERDRANSLQAIIQPKYAVRKATVYRNFVGKLMAGPWMQRCGKFGIPNVQIVPDAALRS